MADEWATIIWPNVPILRLRGDFAPAHRKPAIHGICRAQKVRNRGAKEPRDNTTYPHLAMRSQPWGASGVPPRPPKGLHGGSRGDMEKYSKKMWGLQVRFHLKLKESERPNAT